MASIARPKKKYILYLYIVGETPNCTLALDNLKKICDEYAPNNYTIEIIDLLKFPQVAKEHEILAIPTVIKRCPKPIARMIGNLSNAGDVLVGLNIHKI